MRYFAVYTATMASAGTSTDAVDLGHGWQQAYLEIPTLTSNTQHHIQAAAEADGTYRRVYHSPINSSTSGTHAYAISSGATNSVVPIPSGLRHLKVETTATVDDGATYKIYVSD